MLLETRVRWLDLLNTNVTRSFTRYSTYPFLDIKSTLPIQGMKYLFFIEIHAVPK